MERLLGLSVNKQFIPSIANTIGTDMSNYKVVAPSQFVYIADTSRRGEKYGCGSPDCKVGCECDRFMEEIGRASCRERVYLCV